MSEIRRFSCFVLPRRKTFVLNSCVVTENGAHFPESLPRRKSLGQNSCVVILAVPPVTLLLRNRPRCPQIERALKK